MKRVNGRAIIIDGDEVLLMFRRKIKDGIVNDYPVIDDFYQYFGSGKLKFYDGKIMVMNMRNFTGKWITNKDFYNLFLLL